MQKIAVVEEQAVFRSRLGAGAGNQRGEARKGGGCAVAVGEIVMGQHVAVHVGGGEKAERKARGVAAARIGRETIGWHDRHPGQGRQGGAEG